MTFSLKVSREYNFKDMPFRVRNEHTFSSTVSHQSSSMSSLVGGISALPILLNPPFTRCPTWYGYYAENMSICNVSYYCNYSYGSCDGIVHVPMCITPSSTFAFLQQPLLQYPDSRILSTDTSQAFPRLCLSMILNDNQSRLDVSDEKTLGLINIAVHHTVM